MSSNKIDQATAVSWIQAWRLAPVAGIKAYFIPKQDFTDIISDPLSIGARAYLAFGNTDGNPDEAKLVLVSVEGNPVTGGTDAVAKGIYDFTQPCPSYCDVNSPLYLLDSSGQYPVVPGNTIDIVTAVDWATNWRSNPDNNVKAYFIPKSDISDLLKDANCMGFRAYLGLDTVAKKATVAKLMIVSVDDNGASGGKDNINNGIFDFTQPCPSYCDTSSILYTL